MSLCPQVTDEHVEAVVGRESTSAGVENPPIHYTTAKDNMEKVTAMVKRKWEDIGQDDSFRVGDKVLRQNVRQEQRKGGKMESSLLGPFTIIKIEGKSADLVTKKCKTVHTVNIDQLCKHIDKAPRLPHKWPATSPFTISLSPDHLSPIQIPSL